VAGLIALAIVAWVLLSLVRRMRYGVDVTDEAFYAGLPYRFALGDRPFVDELNLAQTGGLVLYPFVKMFVVVTGGATGIIFYLRVLHTAFLCALGIVTFALCRTRLPLASSAIVGAACLCFIPYGAPGLSYNTLGSGFLTLALFTLARWLLGPAARTRLLVAAPFWAGAAFSVAAICYPPFAVPAALAAVVVVLTARGLRVYTISRLAAGGAIPALCFIPTVLTAGRDNLRQMMEYSNSTLPQAPMTTWELLSTFMAGLPQLPIDLLVIAGILYLSRRFRFLAVLILPFVPFLARGTTWPGNLEIMGYVSCFAMFGPLFALGNRGPFAKVVMRTVWLPSAVAGMVVMQVSTQRWHGAALGLFPAAIASAALLAAWIDDAASRVHFPGVRAAFSLAPAVFLRVFLSHTMAEAAPYRDGPVAVLTEEVTSGPFKGISTTAARKKMLKNIQADVITHKAGDRVTFYFDFPAGYLIAEQRPAVTSAWIFNIPARNAFDARFFVERAHRGDLVVNWQNGVLSSLPLDRAVAEHCTLVTKGDGYALFVVNR
jgi:hypothetical protein